MGILEALLNLIFPPHCPACGRYVKKRGLWCEACLRETLRPHKLPLDGTMELYLPGGVWALGVYKHVLRDMVRDLKYNKKRSNLPYLHSFIEAGIAQLGFESLAAAMVVPVPLHRERLQKRGFNQAELLFREPMAKLGISMELVLARQRNTTPQYGLNAVERHINLQEAIALEPGMQQQAVGRDIILVDDIMTTGSSLLACSQALLEAGARSITGLVVASGRKEKSLR